MRIEYDPRKAASNLKKHRVSFEEAVESLHDPLARVISDPDCEGEEDDDGKENRAQNVILHDSPGRYEHDEHGHLRSDVDVLRECFPCSSSQNQRAFLLSL